MNDLMSAHVREHPGTAAAAGPGRAGRLPALVRLHLLGLRGPAPSLLGLLLMTGALSLLIADTAPVTGFLAGTALVGGLSGVMVERSGSNRLLACLPVSRAEVVNSYWAVAALLLLTASSLHAVMGLLMGAHPRQLLVLPLVLIAGQALGIPVFLHFGRGRGLLIWMSSIVVLGVLGLLILGFGPIQGLALGTGLGRGVLLALGAGALTGLWALSHRLYLGQDQ
ncbi:ABC-2 transporter permease [Actinomyces bowdenii]|uniref:ABC-2 transporter permease n=1 Tax=Actinomyces bowdenii TaxID=131109 RepID=UPI00312CA224